MSVAAIALTVITMLWLLVLVLWQAVERWIPETPRRAVDLSSLRRGRRIVGWALVALSSFIYLATMLRYAFAIPQHVTPTEAWAHIVIWNATASAWVELGILLRYFERSDRRPG